jgi:hypothetical protein
LRSNAASVRFGGRHEGGLVIGHDGLGVQHAATAGQVQ